MPVARSELSQPSNESWWWSWESSRQRRLFEANTQPYSVCSVCRQWASPGAPDGLSRKCVEHMFVCVCGRTCVCYLEYERWRAS